MSHPGKGRALAQSLNHKNLQRIVLRTHSRETLCRRWLQISASRQSRIVAFFWASASPRPVRMQSQLCCGVGCPQQPWGGRSSRRVSRSLRPIVARSAQPLSPEHAAREHHQHAAHIMGTDQPQALHSIWEVRDGVITGQWRAPMHTSCACNGWLRRGQDPGPGAMQCRHAHTYTHSRTHTHTCAVRTHTYAYEHT